MKWLPILARMLKAIFKGNRKAFSGASQGDVALPIAEPASFVVALVLLTTSSAILALHFEHLAINKG